LVAAYHLAFILLREKNIFSSSPLLFKEAQQATHAATDPNHGFIKYCSLLTSKSQTITASSIKQPSPFSASPPQNQKRKEIKERVGAKKKTVGTMSRKREESCS
jgi:hypothetical protein